jgi:hypothetical protein
MDDRTAAPPGAITRLTGTPPAADTDRTTPAGGGKLLSRRARISLVAALGAVVGMAFAVSWTALRDVATAIGIPTFAATLYPFVVDGLMALALVATLTLTGDAKRTALRVLAAYTAASLTLNYVHGLVPGLHGIEDGERVRLAAEDVAHWLLVGLAAALPVGAIYFGSDLVARVLHHRPEESTTHLEESADPSPQESAPTDVPAPATVAPDSQPEQLKESAPTDTQESAPAAPTRRPRPDRPTTPRRKTGPVPTAARPTAPRRTLEELLLEARDLPADTQESAERLRTTLRIGAARAREVRDVLAAEREQPEESLLEEQPTGEQPAPVEPAEERPHLTAVPDTADSLEPEKQPLEELPAMVGADR